MNSICRTFAFPGTALDSFLPVPEKRHPFAAAWNPVATASFASASPVDSVECLHLRADRDVHEAVAEAVGDDFHQHLRHLSVRMDHRHRSHVQVLFGLQVIEVLVDVRLLYLTYMTKR